MVIPEKYLRFFLESANERHLLIQGSRRSSKTWSAILWLRLLGKVMGRPYNILLVDSTFPALQLLIQDFEDCTGLTVTSSQRMGYYVSDDNILWQFKNFPSYKPTAAQGTKADCCLINEALNIDYRIITTLSMGVRDQIIYTYNPTAKNADLEKLYNGHNKLCTIWKDNPYLTDEQKAEFEGIKERAMKPTSTPYEKWAYEVYYLGDFSTLSGKVFNKIYDCSVDEYMRVPSLEILGLDFGFSPTGLGDETALAGVKVDRSTNSLYLHQYIYDSTLTNDKELAKRMFYTCGLNKYSYIVGDYAGAGRQRMDNITTGGMGTWLEEDPNICQFTIQNAIKPGLDERIMTFLGFDRIYVTVTSVAMKNEFVHYEFDENTGLPKDKMNHLIDCCAYGTKMHQYI